MTPHRVVLGDSAVVVRHLETDDEASACATPEDAAHVVGLLILSMRGAFVGELRDYIVRGHSEWLMRKSIAPLADWTTSRVAR